MSTTDEILKGRFIKRVFQEAGADIISAQTKYMNSRGFESPEWKNRNFNTSDSALTIQHLGRHRFVDMRTRNSKSGKKKKKSHPVHNRIIFGHYNFIVRELSYGFTQSVVEELKQLED